MNEFPLVSVCIPTYNSEKYIDMMLSTILNQTYKNIEVIISDNFSTDNTLKILLSYKSNVNWRIYQNDKNIGALNNMGKLIEMATGKYVAVYHADDMYDSHIIEKSVAVLEGMPKVSLVSTMGISIDENNKKLSVFTLPKKFFQKTSLPFSPVFLEILSQRPFFLITPSIMTRGTYYKENSKFNNRYRSSADYGKWFEILQKGDLYIIDELLINYRTHNQQGTFLEIKKNYSIPDSIPLYQDYSKINEELFGNEFNYIYYKLMLVQAIKLNNIGRFKKSQIFLRMILKRSKKYFFPWIAVYMLFNLLNLNFNLNILLIIKNSLKR
jgi:glycosyltransferase involved in cell wall biosynthesis